MTPIVGRPPNNIAWTSELGYSRTFARLLTRVYAKLSCPAHRPTKAELEEMRNALPDDCDCHLRMSAHQRFSLASTHAQLALGVGADEAAKAALLRAFKLARKLKDRGALAECMYLAGWWRQSSGNYAKAAYCFQMAATTLRSLRENQQLCDTAFELLAISELAVHRFLLAQYEQAEFWIEQGKILSLDVSQAQRQLPLATLFWVKSLLQRWRGRLEDALRCAFDSADLLAPDKGNPSFGRIHAIAGEIALDIANRYCAERPAHGRDMWLSIALARIEEAKEIAVKANDPCGEGLAILGRVRHSRMSVENADRGAKSKERLAAIKEAEEKASGDATLLCQVETARGHEADASGHHEEALKHYHRAMALVNGAAKSSSPSLAPPDTQIPRGLAQALSVWPRREILRSTELIDV